MNSVRWPVQRSRCECFCKSGCIKKTELVQLLNERKKMNKEAITMKKCVKTDRSVVNNEYWSLDDYYLYQTVQM